MDDSHNDEGFTRRDFLKAAGAFSIVNLVSKMIPTQTYASGQIDFGFADIGLSGVEYSKPHPLSVTQGLIPLGVERYFVSDTEQQRVMKAILPEIEKASREIKGLVLKNYEMHVVHQNYGVPKNIEWTSGVINYARMAQDFLNSQNLTMRRLNFKWQNLEGKVYRPNFNGIGFVGDHYYRAEKIRTTLMDVYGKKYDIEKGHAFRLNGATIFSDIDAVNVGIFVSANQSALISPFSEMLHSITMQRLRNNFVLGVELAVSLDEAVCENLAYHFSKRLCKQIGDQKVNAVIDDFRRRTMSDANIKNTPSYKYLRKVSDFIERYDGNDKGLLAAFNLYMEDPHKFMKAVGINP